MMRWWWTRWLGGEGAIWGLSRGEEPEGRSERVPRKTGDNYRALQVRLCRSQWIHRGVTHEGAGGGGALRPTLKDDGPGKDVDRKVGSAPMV